MRMEVIFCKQNLDLCSWDIANPYRFCVMANKDIVMQVNSIKTDGCNQKCSLQTVLQILFTQIATQLSVIGLGGSDFMCNLF